MYLNIDLAETIINNNSYFEGSSTCFSENNVKGYKLIDHAYDLLKNNDEFYLSDVISNLRKAINYRVLTLFEKLGINNINFTGLGKKSKLEKLEQLGIIKPLLINKLLEIRNGIEYRGDSPPTQNECRELIDIVWYFYRSTDKYCNKEPDSLLVEFENSDDFLCIDFDFHSHKTLNVYGQIPSVYFSEQKTDGAILLHDYNITGSKAFNIDSKITAFSCKIYISELNNYFYLLSIALYEWGNFLL